MASVTSMVIGAVAGVGSAVAGFVNAAEAEAAAEEAREKAAEVFWNGKERKRKGFYGTVGYS